MDDVEWRVMWIAVIVFGFCLGFSLVYAWH
jgi:hypothetical protein